MTRRSLLLGVAFAGVLASVTVSVHLDIARELASQRELMKPPPWWQWALVGFFGTPCIAYVTLRATGSPMSTCAVRARQRAAVLAWLALLAWLVWMAWSAVDEGGGWRPAFLAAIALELAALLLLARAAGPDGDVFWRRTEVLRAQFAVLAILSAVVFVVPLTAAQVEEVLRSWADRELYDAICAVASALLLGAVLRASAVRLINPPTAAQLSQRWPVKPTVVGMAVVGVLAAWWLVKEEAWLGLVVLGAVAILAGATKWAEPRHADWEVAGVDVQPGREIASALASVPTAILLVSLVSATSDTVLLPGHDAETGRPLLLTFLVAAALVLLIADAGHQADNRSVQPSPRSRKRQAGMILVGGVGLLAGLCAAAGPTVADGHLEVLWTAPLSVLAVATVARVGGDRGAPALAVGWGVAIGLMIATYAEPIEAARAYGTFGIAMIGATVAMLVLHATGSAGAARTWRATGRLLPARVPVLTLWTIWLGAVVAWPDDSAHQARTVASRAERLDLGVAVKTWKQSHGDGPMVLVGASGGGAKAAYWTTLVIDCLLADGPPAEADDECRGPASARGRRLDRLFLASGVSGGSVGIYHLLANRARARAGDPWVRSRVGPEVLSPVTAWGLFHDLPNAMIRRERDPAGCRDAESCRKHADRSLVQELAISGASGWKVGGHVPLLHRRRGDGPLPVFNAALDGGSHRVLMSPLDLAPQRPADLACTALGAAPVAAAFDAADVLEPGRDLPLVTAALLSARFPVIAPAGRLGAPTGPDDRLEGQRCSSTVVRNAGRPARLRDGGYIENTGLLTIVELLPAIREALGDKRPILVISIDDDAAVLDDDRKITKEGRNLLGISQRASTGYLTRLARDPLTGGRFPNVHYVRLSPPPHPGARATTGWQVSPTARRHDLAAALREAPMQSCLRALRAYLDATATSDPRSSCREADGQ